MFFSDTSPFVFALLMLPAIINLWGISHAMRHTFPGENERVLWVVACIFLPILGGVLYLIFGLRRSKPMNTDNGNDMNESNKNINNNDNSNTKNNNNGE